MLRVDNDSSVQGTNDDAQISKLSCTKAGYFKDDFIQLFVRRGSRRSPLINRGYYSRHAALRQLLDRFLEACETAEQPAQVLCLGAGFDTTWFQYAKDAHKSRYKCLEVDFKEVTKRKASVISKEESLRSLLPPLPDGQPGDGVDVTAGEVVTPGYCLLPVDLRDLASLEAAVARAGLDPSGPTFVLSECVLVYMEPRDSAAVVRWVGQHFSSVVMAIYEQIKPDDAFGRQMVSNLEMRGCPLKGLPATPTLEAHKQRFLSAGWQWAEALDMDTLYCSYLDRADCARIERLEIFDEFEEWHMIQEHYCVALGRNDAQGWLQEVRFLPAPPLPPAPGGGLLLPRALNAD